MCSGGVLHGIEGQADEAGTGRSMAHVADYAKKGIHGGLQGGSKILSGFRDFLLRGNVVGWLYQLHQLRADAYACSHPG